MHTPSHGWSHVSGADREACRCGSWKQHWIHSAFRSWPAACSVLGCGNAPTVGAHIAHAHLAGERIVPMCDACSALSGKLILKRGVSVPRAAPSRVCRPVIAASGLFEFAQPQ